MIALAQLHWEQLVWALLAWAALATLGAVLAVLKFSAAARRIAVQLDSLSQATSRIADEVGELSSALNRTKANETLVPLEAFDSAPIELLGRQPAQGLQYASRVVLLTVGSPLVKAAAFKAGAAAALRRLRLGIRGLDVR